MTANLTHLLSFSSVMKSVGGILLAVIVLLVMVTIHEFGHYVAGKLLGFKINEFSVGFGPALLKKRNKKTGELFALRVVPLGGYCAFEGEDDTEEGDEGKSAGAENEKAATDEEDPFSGPDDGQFSEPLKNETPKVENTVKGEAFEGDRPALKFNDQPPWKRIIVLIAGAAMNYLLALFVIIVMFIACGRPHTFIAETEAPPSDSSALVSAEISEEGDSLQAGDIILTLNGKDMYMETDFIDALRGRKAGDRVAVSVLRKNGGTERERLNLSVTLQADANFASMLDTGAIYEVLGLDVQTCRIRSGLMKQGFFRNVGDAFAYSAKLGGMVLRTLGELLTGKIGISSMGGPVTTISMTAQAASYGIANFLNIAALIGVNLAVFNLLPIPALDGSKVVFTVIEWIRGKPINRKVEAMIHFIGIIVLFGFAILVDVLHWVL